MEGFTHKYGDGSVIIERVFSGGRRVTQVNWVGDSYQAVTSFEDVGNFVKLEMQEKNLLKRHQKVWPPY